MQNFKLMFAFAFLIILASCKKTNSDVQVPMQEALPITSQSAANQVRYAETNLKMIGTEIAKLTNDPAFVNFVHAEVNKKFDRQFEVLIGDLKKNPTWSEKLNNSKINEGLNAFKNLEGESFFPHIYLPKFQYDEDENINNTSSRYSVDSILYVFYGGNEDPLNLNGNYKAYYLDDNDSLRVWGEVNEEYANEHEVWVFA